MGAFKSEQDFEGILWVTLDVPDARVNTLGTAVLNELESHIEQWERQTDLTGIVIQSGKASGFIAGADVKEFDALTDPTEVRDALARVHAMFDRIENLNVPVVAAVHGFCLGGGLELALACHYRVATEDARLGFPEVKLGIFPGFGGTGRSVARAGALKAMTAMLTGKNYKARQARAMGWVDQVVPTRDRLHWQARKAVLQNRKPKPLGRLARLLQAPGVRSLLARQMRKQTAAKVRPEHYPAPFALIDLFESHGQTPERLRTAELDAFPELLLSESARQLRRLFFLSEGLKRSGGSVRRVHVIGAGVMGGDIAAWCALSGLHVTLQDLSEDALSGAIKRAQGLFKKRLRGVLAKNAESRLLADPDGQGVARADVIIEAVVERLDVKQTLFGDLEKKAKPTAILASNTSSIPLEDIAQDMEHPERLVGIHFFNPVAQLPLVEVVRGAQTGETTLEVAQQFVTQIKKYPVVVASKPGFLVNRALAPYMTEALAQLRQGTPAETLDAAALAFGMPMGPIELVDTVGLDICAAVSEELGLMTDDARAWLAPKLERGELGRKSGRGFYVWQKGKPQRDLPKGDAALGKALLKPLVDAVEQCLAEGVVSDTDQADIGLIMGTGFAPFTGGPLTARAQGIV